MLDGLTPEQFDEWLAYQEIEPDRWERLFTILGRGLCAVANVWGCKLEPRHIDPYLEKQEATQAGTQTGTAATEYVSPDQGAAMLRMAIGAAN